MDSTYSELEELVTADYPDAWRPDLDMGHPNPLVGDVIDVREVATRRETLERVLTVRAQDGTLYSVWPLGAVLKSDLAAAQPGNALAVRWLGMRTNAEGVQYRAYRVAIKADAA